MHSDSRFKVLLSSDQAKTAVRGFLKCDNLGFHPPRTDPGDDIQMSSPSLSRTLKQYVKAAKASPIPNWRKTRRTHSVIAISTTRSETGSDYRPCESSDCALCEEELLGKIKRFAACKHLIHQECFDSHLEAVDNSDDCLLDKSLSTNFCPICLRRSQNDLGRPPTWAVSLPKPSTIQLLTPPLSAGYPRSTVSSASDSCTNVPFLDGAGSQPQNLGEIEQQALFLPCETQVQPSLVFSSLHQKSVRRVTTMSPEVSLHYYCARSRSRTSDSSTMLITAMLTLTSAPQSPPSSNDHESQCIASDLGMDDSRRISCRPHTTKDSCLHVSPSTPFSRSNAIATGLDLGNYQNNVRRVAKAERVKDLPPIPPGFQEARTARNPEATTPSENPRTLFIESEVTEPSKENVNIGNRFPLDLLVAVPLDVRMAGPNLKILQETLTSLLAKFDMYDSFGLVSYGSDVEKVNSDIDLNRPFHFYSFCTTIKQLRAGNQPDSDQSPLGAVKECLSMFKRRANSQRLSHMFVLSDSAQSGLQEKSIAQACRDQRIMVHTFGLGEHHDMKALSSLSEKTHGSYHIVGDLAKLQECVMNCFSRLAAISHTDLCLYLAIPRPTSSISNVHICRITGAAQSCISSDSQTAKIWLPTLYHMQSRTFLVELFLDVVDNSEGSDITHILQTSASFRHMSRPDCFIKSRHSATLSIKPSTLTNTSIRDMNFDILLRQFEILVSNTICRVIKLMAGSQVPAALYALEETQAVLLQLSTIYKFDKSQADHVKHLCADIGRIGDYATSETQFKTVGKQRAIQLAQILRDQMAWTDDFSISILYKPVPSA